MQHNQYMGAMPNERDGGMPPAHRAIAFRNSTGTDRTIVSDQCEKDRQGHDDGNGHQPEHIAPDEPVDTLAPPAAAPRQNLRLRSPAQIPRGVARHTTEYPAIPISRRPIRIVVPQHRYAWAPNQSQDHPPITRKSAPPKRGTASAVTVSVADKPKVVAIGTPMRRLIAKP